MAWLCCRLSFSLLRSAIACLRGARSHRGCLTNCGALDLALAEGQVCDHASSVLFCLAILTFCARGAGYPGKKIKKQKKISAVHSSPIGQNYF